MSDENASWGAGSRTRARDARAAVFALVAFVALGWTAGCQCSSEDEGTVGAVDASDTGQTGDASTDVRPGDTGAEDTGSGDATDGEGPDLGECSCTTDADCTLELAPCQVAVCDGCRCTVQDAPDGTPCDDGDLCTEEDGCAAGTCTGVARTCDDGNPCTDDSCTPAAGCAFEPLDDGAPCDDGNACTEGDSCLFGVCTPGPNGCTELCDNGEDDDLDGATDCDDTGCMEEPLCTGWCPVDPSVLGCGSEVAVDFADGLAVADTWPCAPGVDLGGPGQAWTFEAPAPVSVTVTADGLPEGARLLLVPGTQCDPMACVTATDAELSFTTLGGEPFTLAVDGPPEMEGTGTLQVTCAACEPMCAGKQCGPDGCGGTCGTCDPGTVCKQGGCVEAPENDTCDTAAPVAGDLPLFVEGMTAGAGDDYAMGAGESSCPGIETPATGLGRPDVAYAWTAPATGSYVISVYPDFDAALYVTTDCAALGESCLAGSNAPGQGIESVTVELQQGQTVFIVVDGGVSGSGGTFVLTLSPAPCTPQCQGNSTSPPRQSAP